MIAGVIPLIIGLASLIVGCFLTINGYGSFSYLESLKHYSAFTPQQLVEVRDLKSGYVEGLISDRNSVLVEDFVTYIRFNYEGLDKRWESNPSTMNMNDEVLVRRPIWQEDERITPSLLLDVDDNQVQIAAGYNIHHPLHTWVSTVTYKIDITKKYEGFHSGDRVVAVGQPALNQQTPILNARALHSGTFEDYCNSYRSGGWFGLIAGIFLIVIGLIGSIVGIILLIPLLDFL